MRAFIFYVFLFTAAVFYGIPAAHAIDTDFVVTVKARDAKFIGTAVGGAHVIIRDRRTGDIIANGTTAGSTGDTKLLMAETQPRDAALVTDGSARFSFSLNMFEPIPATISATAPLGQQQSLVTVSEDILLLPGKDYTSGNGIMLDMPGFAVDVVSPLPNQKFKHNPDVPVTIEANIMKLCGCHIAKDSPWPPERYDVEALVYRDTMLITSVKLPYSGEPGIYALNLNIPVHGTYRLMVTAFDKQTKEAGMDTTTIVLEE
ncbi:MAG: hypothetical protein H6867_05240 [Rhodospirillales bacterium]|nr:hypothetical protein [Rhodospirillales bacterium]MCB9994933.1 hypothetical protein [Rhodospirillales bacterium]